MNNKYQRTKKAFTLVEVLVVVVIIGILFLVVMGRVDFTTDTARESGVDTVLKSYQLAANAVGLDRAGFTNDLNSLVDQLNKRLDSELQLLVSNNSIVTTNQDPWGTEFRIEYYQPYKSNGELRFTSAGPDEVFDTGDDIIFVSRYDTSKGRGEMVNEYPKNDPYHTHAFIQEIQDPAYLCEEANCITPTLYFKVCECGQVGTTYFSVGSVDTSKHGEKVFTYSSYNDDQHLVSSSCKRCKMQLGATAANHVIDEGQNICLVCGEVYNHTHNYTLMIASDDTIAHEATCLTAATYYYSCTCGAKSDETFDDGGALGHNPVYGGSKEIHVYCARCNATMPDAHTYSGEVLYDSTCAVLGAIKYTCACGHSYNEAIETKPHTPGADAGCLTQQKCTVCDTVLQEAKGHNYSYIGIDSMHSQCIRCGTIITEHTMSSSVANPATCISKGKTLYSCECGYSYVRDDIPMNPSYHANQDAYGNPEEKFVGTKDVHSIYSCCNVLVAANHTYEQIILVAPTCNSTGSTKYQCQCGYSYVMTEPIVEHVWGAEATCLTAQTCVFCGFINVEALGHDAIYGGHETSHEKCSRCHEVLNVDHEYNIVYQKASTCVKNGIISYSCECGSQYNVELPLSAHKPKANSICTEATTCEVCNASLAAGTAHTLAFTNVSASVHGICTKCSYVETKHNISTRVISIATCISYEQIQTSCECGYSTVSSNVAKGYNPNVHEQATELVNSKDVHERYACCKVALPTQHTYTSRITTPSTCIKVGVETFECACGYSYTENIAINETNHDTTCTLVNGGTTGVHTKWSKCGATQETAHTYVSKTTPSTCITLGKTEYTCACGYKYSVNLTTFDPNNHEKGKVYGKTELSHEQYDCCKVVTSKNHTFTKDNVTYSKSCGGAATGVCACGYKRTETPTVTLHSEKAATCKVAKTLTHYLDFDMFPDVLCTPHTTGSVNEYNHESAQLVAAKTAGVCQKRACCGKSADTTHDWGKASYNLSIGTGKASVTCTTCKYVKSQTVTGEGAIIQTRTCKRVEKTKYTYDFSSPFVDKEETFTTREKLPHDYTYDYVWEQAGAEFFGNWTGDHRYVDARAKCTKCGDIYYDQVPGLPIPNGWLDSVFDACTQLRGEYQVWGWMFDTRDDQGANPWAGQWSRCYDGICNHWFADIPGHVLQSFETLEPVDTVQPYITSSSSLYGCTGKLTYKCGLCKSWVIYNGTTVTKDDDAYKRTIDYLKLFNPKLNKDYYCVFKLNMTGDFGISVRMYVIEGLNAAKYGIYFDTKTQQTYMVCKGH